MLSTIVLRAQPDERLVTLAAGGSQAAFETIVARYRRDLLAYCSRLLLSDSRAEDATQQALVAAWTALRSGAEVRQLKPWLYRITHNQAVSVRRRPGWDFAELSESLSVRDAPESDLERRMLMRETLAAVAALPAAQRQAILQTAVDGDSYAQVAHAMGVSETAVRGLVQRARHSVRAAVAAVTPWPLVLWAAGIGRRHGDTLAWVSEAVAGPGGASVSVGAGAVVTKSAAVLATSAVLVGGGLTPGLLSPRSQVGPRVHRAAAARSRRATVRHMTTGHPDAHVTPGGGPFGARSPGARAPGARSPGARSPGTGPRRPGAGGHAVATRAPAGGQPTSASASAAAPRSEAARGASRRGGIGPAVTGAHGRRAGRVPVAAGGESTAPAGAPDAVLAGHALARKADADRADRPGTAHPPATS